MQRGLPGQWCGVRGGCENRLQGPSAVARPIAQGFEIREHGFAGPHCSECRGPDRHQRPSREALRQDVGVGVADKGAGVHDLEAAVAAHAD
eukprot:4947898-Alexandrium_andersonii.AAC.1